MTSRAAATAVRIAKWAANASQPAILRRTRAALREAVCACERTERDGCVARHYLSQVDELLGALGDGACGPLCDAQARGMRQELPSWS